MSNLTFEQALRQTLADSCFYRIDGSEDHSNWAKAWKTDYEAIEGVMDKLCADLSKITGRKIQRFTKLRPNIIISPGNFEDMAKSAHFQISRAIKIFIARIIYSIKANPYEAPLYYPINRIWWDKGYARTILPSDESNKLQNIKLAEPVYKECDEIEQPSHIQRILKICETTHFDYQPFVLMDDKSKVLGLRLGCDWNDFAISTWDKKPFLNFDRIILMAVFCFFFLFYGAYLATCISPVWLTAIIYFSFGVIGVIGGISTVLLMAKYFKAMRL